MNTNKLPGVQKYATILKHTDGVATVRMHIGNNGCQGCSENKHGSCALYTFGTIFSRHRNIWQIPSKHHLKVGEQVQLIVPSNALMKIAASCYGLPIVILIGSATLSHLLIGIEWLTLLIGLSSLVASFIFVKRWLCSIDIPDIKLIR